MAGVGDSWGTREELLHPRDKNGRFRSKWKMASGVVSKILAALAAFSPRTFQSDGQAAQYNFNTAKPGRFGGGQGYARLSADYDAANDALRAGSMDASTQKFVKMMDDSSVTLKDDIIVHRRVGPEAFGLTPETMALDEGGIEDLTGKLVADRGYSSSNIGTPLGTAPIQLTIAVPKGTKAIIPARSRNDRQIYLDRDQEIRVTKVDPDGRGGFYVLAVAQPRTPGDTPEPIGGPGAPGDTVAREGQVEQGRQLGLKAMKVPDDAQPAQHGSDRQRQEQGLPPRTVAPSPQGSTDTGPGGPPPRNEPVVTESLGQGGAPQAAGPPAATPEVAGGVPETPIREADFKEAAKDLPIPSAGKRRREWNQAYMGVRSGKRDPDDILRELSKDIEVNKALLAEQKSRGDSSDSELEADIKAQEGLADLIGRHHNIDGKTSDEAPAAPADLKSQQDSRIKAATRERVAADVSETDRQVAAAKKTAPAAKQVAAKKAAPVKKPAVALTPEQRQDIAGIDLPELKAYRDLRRQGKSHADARQGARDRNLPPTPGEEVDAKVSEAPPAKKAAAPAASKETAPDRPVTLVEAKRRTALDAVQENKISDPSADSTYKRIAKGLEDGTMTVPQARKQALDSARYFHESATTVGRNGRATPEARGKAHAGETAKATSYEKLADALTESQSVTKTDKYRRSPVKKAAPAKKAASSKDAELADIRDRLSKGGLTRQETTDITARVARLNGAQSRSKRPTTDDEILAMTKVELLQHAKEKGVDVRPSWTKEKIKAALNAPAAEQTKPDDLNATVPELKKIAAAEGVPVTSKMRKADIQAAIRAKREGATSTPEVPAAETAARTRQAEIDKARGASELLAEIEERRNNGDSDAIIRRNVSTMARQLGVDSDLVDQLIDGDAGTLDRSTRALGLSPIGVAGGNSTFDPKQHESIGGSIPQGAQVEVIRPGYTWSRPGEGDIQLSKAKVQEITPPLVDNPVAQKPVVAPDRKADFDQAWQAKGFQAPGSAGRSLTEISDDVSTGRITPEESIRRLETEIELNNAEIADIDRTLRGDMSPEARAKLQAQRKELSDGTKTQVQASKFMREHFKQAPAVTPDEVRLEIEPEVKAAVDAATPDQIRDAAKLQGLRLKGDSKEDLLKDLVRQLAGKELESRAAKKVAPAPKAPDKAKPNLEESPYQRIDAQALAEGLDLRTESDQKMLKGVQELLDGTDTRLGKNPTPAQIGRDLEKWTHGPAGPFYRAAVMQTTPDSKRDAEWHAERDAHRAQGDERLKLADRLKNTRRRRKQDSVPDVTPTVTRDEKKEIASVAEVTGIPAEQLEAKALTKKKAEAPPKQSAVQVAETLRTVSSREEAATLLQGRTKAELQEIAKVHGSTLVKTGDNKSHLIHDIVEASVGFREDSEVMLPGGLGGTGHTRAELQDMPIPDLKALEDDLGIERTSLNRGDRIDAILAKQRASESPGPSADIEGTIRDTYERLANRPGGWVGLAQIRAEVASTRAEMDAALSRLAVMPDIRIIPIANLKSLTPEDRAAAIHLGGELKHAIAIEKAGSTPSVAPKAKPAGVAVRRNREVPQDDRGLTLARERPGNDEDVYIPNGGRDQGAMHFDSEMGQLWRDLYMDDREPNSFVNEIARMGDRMHYISGDADLEQDVLPLLEKLKGRASDSAVAERIQRAIDGISAPPVAVPDLPEGTPAPIRAALEKLSKIPTARKKGRVGLNTLKESVLDKKVRLLREFVEGGVRGRDFEREFEERDLHESTDGAFRMWRAVEKLFLPTIVTGYTSKGQPIEEPNPDYPAVREWLRDTQSQTKRAPEPSRDGGAAPQKPQAQKSYVAGRDVSAEVDLSAIDALGMEHLGGTTYADRSLTAIQDAQGFNGPPEVVSREEFDRAVASGSVVEAFRGLSGSNAEQYAEEFRSGDHFPGSGWIGGGTYMTTETALLGDWQPDAALRIGLKSDARTISHADIRQKLEDFQAANPGMKRRLDSIAGNEGRLAALLGYDAIVADGGEVVLLNRTAVIVQEA